MLKVVLIVLAALAVGFVVLVLLRPAEFRTTRHATIPAPAAVVFAQVNELAKWEAWSPWAKIDPAMKQTYEGPPAGPGAISRWNGNNEVGEGSNTIVESRPNELIRMKLEFQRPFTCSNAVEFNFEPVGEETKITWTMTGKNNFVAKAFGLFMNMDKMVGGQFEQGLANLRAVSLQAGK